MAIDSKPEPVITIQLFLDGTWEMHATKAAEKIVVSAMIANMVNDLHEEIKRFVKDPGLLNEAPEEGGVLHGES